MKSIPNPRLKFPVLVICLIFFAMLPVTMIVPVFKDMIKDRLGGDNLSVSFFMSTAMLGSFLFSPVAGYFSDKTRTRKWFITAFSFLDGASFFLITFIQDLFLLQCIRFLEGAFHIFVIGLLLSLIVDRENDPENPKFFRRGILLGLAGMFLSLGVGLGSPLGILGKNNPLLPFYVAGSIMFAIGLVSFFWLSDYPFRFKKEVTFRAWVQAISEKPLVLVPSAFNFIDRFTVGFFVTSFNLHLREDLQMNPGQVGLFLSLVLIPMSLFSFPFALLARRWGAVPLMLGGSLLYGGSLALAGSLENITHLKIVLFLCGVGAGVMFVPSMMLASRLAPEGLNASVMAGFTGVGSIGFMLGPIVSVLLQMYLVERYENSFGILAGFFGSIEILMVLVTIPFYRRLTS
jgi:MFS family permease